MTSMYMLLCLFFFYKKRKEVTYNLLVLYTRMAEYFGTVKNCKSDMVLRLNLKSDKTAPSPLAPSRSLSLTVRPAFFLFFFFCFSADYFGRC